MEHNTHVKTRKVPSACYADREGFYAYYRQTSQAEWVHVRNEHGGKEIFDSREKAAQAAAAMVG